MSQSENAGPNLDLIKTQEAPEGVECQHYDAETGVACTTQAVYEFHIVRRGSVSVVNTCENHGTPPEGFDG